MAGSSPAMTNLCAKLRPYRIRHRMRLQAAVGVPHHPHPFLRAFGAQLALEAKLVLDVEARPAEVDGRHHHYVVAEPRGFEKARLRARQRPAGEFKRLEHLEFGDAERVLEQRRGRGVEDFEITRIENDAGRVAVAPFDADRAGVADHARRLIPWRWKF